MAWKNFQWDQDHSTSGSALGLLAGGRNTGGRRVKYRFKEVARAVKFTSNLFGKALQRRIKAAILYATETGKSEKWTLNSLLWRLWEKGRKETWNDNVIPLIQTRYAHMLAELFNHAFNAQVCGHLILVDLRRL